MSVARLLIKHLVHYSNKASSFAHFKSVKRIKEAPMEEIEALIGKSKAEALREGLGA